MERFITAGVLVEGGQRGRRHHRRLQAQARARLPADAEGGVAGHRDQPARGALFHRAGRHAETASVFMLGEPPPEPRREPLDFALVYCPTRKAMLERLNDWFERNDPDVIIGWNVIQFDLRVLQKTADDCGAPLLLGRERRPIEWRTHPGKQGYLFAPMPGRLVIDGIEALKAAVVELSVLQPGDRLAGAAGRGQGHRRRVRQDGRDRAALPGGQARAGALQHPGLRTGPAHLRQGEAAAVRAGARPRPRACRPTTSAAPSPRSATTTCRGCIAWATWRRTWARSRARPSPAAT